MTFSKELYRPPQRRIEYLINKKPDQYSEKSEAVCFFCNRLGYWAKDYLKQNNKKQKYVNRREKLKIQALIIDGVTADVETSNNSNADSNTGKE